ncbi:MAG: reductive dehalogenase [Candidatus Lokiarchaeota archaeon]|nr:reductive dehalogenase [Candidatus Lokiarchaeota archaeon]
MQTKKIDFPYEINEDYYNRFDQKYNMIYRRLWDRSLPTYGKMFEYNINNHINSGEDGYSRIDFALVAAGWTVYEKFPFAFSWHREELMDIGYGVDWMREKYSIKDLTRFTSKVKKAAKFYGASLVGIADVNEKWIYQTGFVRPASTSEADSKEAIRKGDASKSILESPINLPQGIDKVIVMAIEMDEIAISTAPAQPASAAAALGYSRMAFVIACLGEFIRNLGYRAIQCGNDTALSIPLAIDAGLGALGRNGLLLTPEYGPRVRICKVFTDMPLMVDDFNLDFIKKVENFCKTCLKCAEACETDAITKEIEPTFEPATISNNSCVKKYYVDVEKCFEFWIENSGDCGNCIAACPFSKIKELTSSSEFWK